LADGGHVVDKKGAAIGVDWQASAINVLAANEDLRVIVEAWPGLPLVMRAGILAMIRSAGASPQTIKKINQR
jgi:hypothetical protein